MYQLDFFFKLDFFTTVKLFDSHFCYTEDYTQPVLINLQETAKDRILAK